MSVIPIRALWGLARSRRDTAAVKQRGFKSRDDGKTGIGEAANFIADQADGFTGLVGLGQRNIWRCQKKTSWVAEPRDLRISGGK